MADKFLCGAAKVIITPSEELVPYMFGLMDRKYCKVHDDLYLRVIALKSGETKMLLIVYDLDKAPYPAEWTAILEQETGVPAKNILYTAIHTHTAPLTGYRPFEGPNFIERKTLEVQEKVRIYEEFLLRQLLQVSRQALLNLEPARFGYAVGSCDIGVNRCTEYRVRREEGGVRRVLSLGYNAEGLVDHTLLAVRFERIRDGSPVAFLTNYAVHCVAAYLNDCGGGKSFISGDIAGAVSAAMEAEYPGSVALWTSAPAGDINPSQMIQNCCPDMVTGAPTERCATGEDAAEANIYTLASRQLASIRKTLSGVCCDIEDAALCAAEDHAITKCAALTPEIIAPEIQCTEDYTIRTHLMQIGPLTLIGVDGELYTSHGQAMRAATPFPENTFIINHDSSLLPDNPGYVADDDTLQRILEYALEDPESVRGRGGVPGGKIFTAPGMVRKSLQESVHRLIQHNKHNAQTE